MPDSLNEQIIIVFTNVTHVVSLLMMSRLEKWYSTFDLSTALLGAKETPNPKDYSSQKISRLINSSCVFAQAILLTAIISTPSPHIIISCILYNILQGIVMFLPATPKNQKIMETLALLIGLTVSSIFRGTLQGDALHYIAFFNIHLQPVYAFFIASATSATIYTVCIILHMISLYLMKDFNPLHYYFGIEPVYNATPVILTPNERLSGILFFSLITISVAVSAYLNEVFNKQMFEITQRAKTELSVKLSS
eukprot:TRINITY_DN741_c0_g1_i4.p1 TRINITY_DN741_c0_g1~~TRINITY_DN741_c0_g1_i4.p1  ORF type:complete len:251 (-),score=0.06 TRINITY_DN741_c0_g1_i4:246-998(-)